VWFGIAAIESATKKLALEKAPGFQAPLIAETGCDAHILLGVRIARGVHQQGVEDWLEHTVVDWRNFAREVCLSVLEQDSEQIGGAGKFVEIDESKFGKRKYHRGKRVEGVWVFGGIELESKRCFLEVVEDRSVAKLIPLIKKYIRPETTIILDCWRAYSSLSSEGYLT